MLGLTSQLMVDMDALISQFLHPTLTNINLNKKNQFIPDALPPLSPLREGGHRLYKNIGIKSQPGKTLLKHKSRPV
jgi:hypothetical protein